MHTELATVPDFTFQNHSRQPGDCKRSSLFSWRLITLPISLLDGIDIYKHPEILLWWDSLADDARQALLDFGAEQPALLTAGIMFDEEICPDVYDDGGDRYEYLVNHEHRPIGATLGCPDNILPGVSLLAPLWPPYPVSVRYRTWQLSEELKLQLESGFRFMN